MYPLISEISLAFELGKLTFDQIRRFIFLSKVSYFFYHYYILEKFEILNYLIISIISIYRRFKLSEMNTVLKCGAWNNTIQSY